MARIDDLNAALMDAKDPANWNIISNNGTSLVAKNNATGEDFSGTTAAFNLMLKTPTDYYAEALIRGQSILAGEQMHSMSQLKRGGSRLRAGKPWLRSPANVTGMLATSGNATISATVRRGRPCIEVTVAAVAASPQGIHIPLPASTLVTAYQHMVIEIEDAAEWQSGNWRLGFFNGSLGTITVGMQYVQTVDHHVGWNGIHCIAPLPSEWAAVGGGSFAGTSMTQLCVRGVRKASPTIPTKFWIYEIAEGENSSLPQIVIGADDGAKNWYDEGLPILEKYGFSSYMSFIADERGTATRMSQAEWFSACGAGQRGHHAVLHGCRRINGVTINNLTEYYDDFADYGYGSVEEAIAAEIAYQREVMVREGLDPDGMGRNVYVLPQGLFEAVSTAGDMRIINVLQSLGIVGGRRALVRNAIIANGGWSESALYLPIIGHTWVDAPSEAANIAAIIALMQAEVAAGRPVVLMFHEVRATPTAGTHISPANLEAIVSAAATLVRAGSARAGRLTDLVYELRSYSGPVHIGQ